MKFGFVTCVQLGMSCMEAIYAVGGKLDLAITLLDVQAVNKSGRVYLDEFCGEHAIPLLKTRNVNDPAAIEAVRQAEIDWLFIIGWSQIARAELLATSRLGVLGMHPSLLPVGRGRAAVPWAILKELDETGVTLFKLDTGVDTGDILDQVAIPMHLQIDAAELYAKVDAAHVALMTRAYPRLVSGQIVPTGQDHARATYWDKRTTEDGRLDLTGSVWDAERLVRAVTRPYPGAFVEEGDRTLVIWRAEAVEDAPDDATTVDFPDGRLRALEWETRETATGRVLARSEQA